MSSLRQTLHDRGHGMFRSPEPVEQVAALGELEGWKVVRFDLRDVTDKEALLERAATAFELPDWFGGNWDALSDCLTDVVADPGVLVVVADGDRMPEHVRRTALEILADRSERPDDPFVAVVTGKG